MSRLNDAISNVAYILDTLMAYRNIENTGNCNNCTKRIECEYAPKAGQMVRYNCPFYSRCSEMNPSDDKKFYEFLWNTINPNVMEMYLKMFRSKQEKTDGSDGQD